MEAALPQTETLNTVSVIFFCIYIMVTSKILRQTILIQRFSEVPLPSIVLRLVKPNLRRLNLLFANQQYQQNKSRLRLKKIGNGH